MTKVTFELPETMKSQVDERVTEGEFPNTSAYLQTLIARDLQRAEIDRKLQEGLDDYERGDFSVWKKGDTQKLLDEIIARRKQSGQQ